jgi:hypothetical protein
MGKAIQVYDQADGTVNQNLVKVSGAGVTLADTNTAQTFTNKTLTAPTAANAVLNTPTMTITPATLAGLGGNIATAAPIVTTYPGFIFATGANGNVGVQLPVAVAGARYVVQNDATANAVLKVYPQVNSTINALSANSSISMAANSTAEFIAYNTTAWFTNPKVPS